MSEGGTFGRFEQEPDAYIGRINEEYMENESDGNSNNNRANAGISGSGGNY
jgi:hypothetical protein